jgi:hypothetical protein
MTVPSLSKKYLQTSQKHLSASNATYVQVAMSTKKSTNPATTFSTLVCTNGNNNHINQLSTQTSQSGPRPPTMIPLSQQETPTAISTTLTLTPKTGVAHLNAQFSNDQVLQLKKLFKQQYDNVLEIMEMTYSKNLMLLPHPTNANLQPSIPKLIQLMIAVNMTSNMFFKSIYPSKHNSRNRIVCSLLIQKY